MDQMRQDLVINWGINVFSGWGVLGTGILGHLANDPDIRPICAQVMDQSSFVGMDPVRYFELLKVIRDSRAWQYDPNCLWMDPIGNDLSGHCQYVPKRLIGRVVIEKAAMANAMHNLSQYDALLTASHWCAQRLENATGREVKVIHEGVDTSLFHPAPRCGWLPNTFNIFACGKVEYRKAQDIVLRAFRTFNARHPDSRLVTVWNSPFSDLGNGFKGTVEHPLWLNDQGQLDIRRWAHDNGINPEAVLELGAIPNPVLPSVLREMDVMLAPSRVESATSMPVKEAMACGVPVIAGYHSGMKELLTEDNSFRLMKQTPISASSEYFFPVADWEWYESDLEEIDAHLEWCYSNRSMAGWIGACGSAWINENRTVKQHVDQLKLWIQSLG